MERRKLLKGLGGVAGTATLGGIGLLATSGGATATAGSSVANPDTVTTDEGDIKYVAVQSTGRMKWDGFDRGVDAAQIVVSVELKRDGSTLWKGQIHDTGVFEDGFNSNDWGGSGEAVVTHNGGRRGYIASDADWGICQRNRQNNYNNGYGLPNNPAPTSPFTATKDGTNKKTKVILRSRYHLYAKESDGTYTELTGTEEYPAPPVSSANFIVNVINQQSEASFGDADAEGDTEDSASVGIDSQ